MATKKTPLMRMTREQAEAGRRMWDMSERRGRVSASASYEDMALKTWIRYQNSKGELISPPIECELYKVPRRSDANETVVMLHGMCPKCFEAFAVTEDNKTLSLGETSYAKAPEWIREQWERLCGERGIPPSDDDRIPLINSRERWQCDYCLRWCVRVTDGVAVDDTRGADVLYVPLRGARAKKESAEKGKTVDI